MDKKHLGALAETIAVQHLLEQGYEVFRNVSQHGPADIVAWKPETDETRYIDVKTVNSYTKQDGTVSVHRPGKTAEGVEGMFVLKGSVLPSDFWE